MICNRCGVDRDEDKDFPKRHGKRNGRICNPCKVVQIGKWQRENKEYMKSWRQLPSSKAARAKYDKRYRKVNAIKREAHRRVSKALKEGKITRPDICETCGQNKMLDGHHDDYTKPLEVRWLCRSCHIQFHKTRGY